MALLHSLKINDFRTYQDCITRLDKMLLKNDYYVRDIGMISSKYKNMVNFDYYDNYRKAEEAIRKIIAMKRF